IFFGQNSQPTLTGGILPFATVSLTNNSTAGDFATYSQAGGIAGFNNYLTGFRDASGNLNPLIHHQSHLPITEDHLNPVGVGSLKTNSLSIVGVTTNATLGGNALVIASGAVTGSGNLVGDGLGGVLNFGTAEALFSGPGLTVNANVNGSAGMSVFGGGSVS